MVISIKHIFRTLILLILSMALISAAAVAEQEVDLEYHGALFRDMAVEEDDPFYLALISLDDSTPELGDNTSAPLIWLGGLALASAGMIIAQKKMKQAA